MSLSNRSLQANQRISTDAASSRAMQSTASHPGTCATAKASGPQTIAQEDRLTQVEVKLETVLDSVTEIETILRAAPPNKGR